MLTNSSIAVIERKLPLLLATIIVAVHISSKITVQFRNYSYANFSNFPQQNNRIRVRCFNFYTVLLYTIAIIYKLYKAYVS